MVGIEIAQTLSVKAKLAAGECKKVVRGLVPDAAILLYGSVARGSSDPESDYDLLILTDEPLSPTEEDRVRDAGYEVELAHDIVVSTLFYTKEQWQSPLFRAMPFHREVQHDGIEL